MTTRLRRALYPLSLGGIAAGFVLGFGRFLPVPVPEAMARFLVEGTFRNALLGGLLVVGAMVLAARTGPTSRCGFLVVLALPLYAAGCGLQPLGLRAVHRAIVAVNDGRPVEAFRSPVAGAVLVRDVARGQATFTTTRGLIGGRTTLVYSAIPAGIPEDPHETFGPHWVLQWEE
jgi:hypothetical protein